MVTILSVEFFFFFFRELVKKLYYWLFVKVYIAFLDLFSLSSVCRVQNTTPTYFHFHKIWPYMSFNFQLVSIDTPYRYSTKDFWFSKRKQLYLLWVDETTLLELHAKHRVGRRGLGSDHWNHESINSVLVSSWLKNLYDSSVSHQKIF